MKRTTKQRGISLNPKFYEQIENYLKNHQGTVPPTVPKALEYAWYFYLSHQHQKD